MKRYTFFLILVMVVIFPGCKKEEDPVPVAPTADETARDALYSIMKTYYLWYKEMPTVTKSNYPDP